MEKPIKVKAVFANAGGFGFYDNQRRYDGDVFTVASQKDVSKAWMEVLEEPKKSGPKKDSDE